MPTIDEESASICSIEATNNDMLNLVYGGNGYSTIKDGEVKKCNHEEMSPTKNPYLSESVVFDTSNQRYSYSVNSSVISDDNFQGTLGDYYCDDDTTKSKYTNNTNYDNAASGLDNGYYADYDVAKTVSLSHKNHSSTVPPNPADEATLEMTKESDDMPYIPASDDTGMYTGSNLSDSPIPPLDYNSCSIAMYPIDNTSSYVPTVTTPKSPDSHHSDQPMPFGEYIDHNVRSIEMQN